METPIGKCPSCGRMIEIWRCGDTTGGGTYHIVCLECNKRNPHQSTSVNTLGRWVGWMTVTGFMIGMFLVVLLLSGH